MKRLNPIAGIVSAIATAAGLVLLVYQEIDSKVDADIVDFYDDRGNRLTQIVAFCLVVAGAALFLFFLSELRSRCEAAEAHPRTLANAVGGAGAAAVALLVGAASMLTLTSLGVQFSDEFAVDPNLARYMVGAGYVFLTGSVVVNCVTVFASSLLTLRTGMLPRWLGWVGLALVVIAIAEAFLLAVFAVPVWVLITSVVMLRTRETERAPAA